jgi:hypothetical protein
MGYDDDDEPEYEDLLEPPPENAPSNYAEPPELPPFKKNKKKAKRSRWERYQVRHTSSLSFTPHTHTNTHHTASAYFDSLSLSLFADRTNRSTTTAWSTRRPSEAPADPLPAAISSGEPQPSSTSSSFFLTQVVAWSLPLAFRRESRERRPTLTASSIVTLPNSEFKIEVRSYAPMDSSPLRHQR